MVSEPSVTETMVATNSTTMVDTSLTMTASSLSLFPSSSLVNVLNQPLLLSNMANMMTTKLDNKNYIVWRHQITMVLETYSLIELIEEPRLIPDQYLKDLFGAYTTVVNPDFLVWKSKREGFAYLHELYPNSFNSSTHCGVFFSIKGLEGFGEQALLHF